MNKLVKFLLGISMVSPVFAQVPTTVTILPGIPVHTVPYIYRYTNGLPILGPSKISDNGTCLQYNNVCIVNSTFDPANPGPIGGGTPAAITGTTITAGGCIFPAFAFVSDPGTGIAACGPDLYEEVNGTNINVATSSDFRFSVNIPVGWSPQAQPGDGALDIAFSRLNPGAVGVGNGVFKDISGTIQAGVTITDPGCTTTANIGKRWYNITTTTTVVKECLNVAGTLTWVTK